MPKKLNQSEVWKERAERLWQLLDDISTLDDACKGNDSVFRKLAYKTAEKRNKIAHSPDGFKLDWADE